jgi:GDPmannose 4,6-dehydratase
LATDEAHTIRELLDVAFGRADLDWKRYVKHDERYERPAEVDLLIGDPTKAKKILDWEPKVRFRELVEIMVDADMELLAKPTVQKQLGQLP